MLKTRKHNHFTCPQSDWLLLPHPWSLIERMRNKCKRRAEGGMDGWKPPRETPKTTNEDIAE